MGGGSFTDRDWSAYSSSTKGKKREEVFTSAKMKSDPDPRASFDPKTIKVRESRDSTTSPKATPIILAFDVTGSMGSIPHYFVTTGLGVLMEEIFKREPVSNPHVLCMGIGDAYSDKAPLQVTQFEADIRIATQLQDIWLEGNGGGNWGESYNLAHYFAATHTSADSWEKRREKGVIITIGDEPPHAKLEAQRIKKFIGDTVEGDLTSAEILGLLRRQYDVFHVLVEQGSGVTGYGKDFVTNAWKELLGAENVIPLSDYTKLSEAVIARLQVRAGASVASVVASWKGDTSLVVANSLKGVKGGPTTGPGFHKGPVKLQRLTL